MDRVVDANNIDFKPRMEIEVGWSVGALVRRIEIKGRGGGGEGE